MPTFANSTTVRERIVANIETTLAGISIATGYHIDIASVQRVKPGGTVRRATPFIVIAEGAEEAKDGPLPTTSKFLDIAVTTVISGDEDETRPIDQVLSLIAGDVETALMQDRTRGGLAVTTSPVGSMPAEFADKSGVTSPAIHLLITVHYRHHHQDPTLKM